MGKKAGKGAPQAEAPEKSQASGGETYKGWRPAKGGPIVLSDEIKAKIDEYEEVEPSDAEDLKTALEARGLEKFEIVEPWGEPYMGWQGKPTARFNEDEIADISDLIHAWRDADGASDVEAVLLARGMVKTADAEKMRAEHLAEVRIGELGWFVIREHGAPKRGMPGPVSYRAEAGGDKTKTLPTLVEVLAAIEALDQASAPVPSTPTAGGDDHANASLANHATLASDHTALKARVTRGELASLGFRWKGSGMSKPSKTHVEEAVTGLRIAREKKQKHREQDLVDMLDGFGWEKAVASPEHVGAARA